MSFLKMAMLVENNSKKFDPYADTAEWSPWAIGDEGTKGNQSDDTVPLVPKNLDFRSLYPNYKKFVSFASWYHHNRGNWNDVLQLSKKDQEVKSLVDNAIQSFESSANPTSNGDGLYAKFGNQLEGLVEKKKQENGMGAHKYASPNKWTDEDIFGSSDTSIGQNNSDGDVSKRLSNLEQSYSELLRQFNDLKKKLA